MLLGLVSLFIVTISARIRIFFIDREVITPDIVRNFSGGEFSAVCRAAWAKEPKKLEERSALALSVMIGVAAITAILVSLVFSGLVAVEVWYLVTGFAIWLVTGFSIRKGNPLNSGWTIITTVFLWPLDMVIVGMRLPLVNKLFKTRS